MRTPRKTKLRILEIESAFDWLADSAHIGFDDGPSAAFLDLATGEIRTPEGEEELDDWFGDENLLQLPEDLFGDMRWGLLDQFVATLPKDATRDWLTRAIQGKGAFPASRTSFSETAMWN
jgi:hypothetical protein